MTTSDDHVEFVDYGFGSATIRVPVSDVPLLDIDVLMHGSAYVIRQSDGTARRVAPEDVGVVRKWIERSAE